MRIFKHSPTLLYHSIRIALPLVCILIAVSVRSQSIPSPESVIGFKIGEDRKFARYEQIADYFQIVDRVSDRVLLTDIGPTTEGQSLIVAIISAPKNLNRLPDYQQIQAQLYDPRELTATAADSLIQIGKTIVSINCAIHSTELGSSLMAMQLAYELATANDSITQEILNNVIILLIPVHNPDGLDIVYDWYYKYLGTSYEGCRLPRLYHRYAGHDLNRDWFMLTQNETRATVTQIYNVWHPQIVLDLHQMGIKAPRAFVPPYIDPIDPHVHPILSSETAMLGQYIASTLTANGKAGVITNAIFDAWSPSRAYIHYHGGIRILAEIASCQVATPVNVNLFSPHSSSVQLSSAWNYPMPWIQGNWSLQDIIEYEHNITHALLLHAARFRSDWLRNYFQVQADELNNSRKPFAFVIPQNQPYITAVRDMLQILQLGDVSIHQLSSPVALNEQTFSPGDFVLYTHQPARSYLETLFEITAYPEFAGRQAYDATAHNLPQLFGARVYPIPSEMVIPCIPVNEFNPVPGRLKASSQPASFVTFPSQVTDVAQFINKFLETDIPVYRIAASALIDSINCKPGDFLVKTDQSNAFIQDMLLQTGVDAWALPDSLPSIHVLKLKAPKIALYKSWVATADFGWTRFILDKYGFQYKMLTITDIMDGQLSKEFDILILPDQNAKSMLNGTINDKMPPDFSKGLGEDGTSRLHDYVNNGGTLLAIGRAVTYLVKEFLLPVEIVNTDELWAPGPLLTFNLNTSHPIAYGMSDKAVMMYLKNPILGAPQLNPIGWFPEKSLRLSGAIKGEEFLQSRPVLLELPFEKGRLILCTFRPLFRAQTRSLFSLFFNILYYANATEMTLVR
ncbi:hypothetical protein JW960_28700 [candidate division KSB1 bacterium]|nr:hypothetical protein [candidate division KSB1 bacterium]